MLEKGPKNGGKKGRPGNAPGNPGNPSMTSISWGPEDDGSLAVGAFGVAAEAFGAVAGAVGGTVFGAEATFGAAAVAFGAGTLVAAKIIGKNTTNTGNNIFFFKTIDTKYKVVVQLLFDFIISCYLYVNVFKKNFDTYILIEFFKSKFILTCILSIFKWQRLFYYLLYYYWSY